MTQRNRALISAITLVSATGALFLGVAPTQAQESPSSATTNEVGVAAMSYNGYNINNQTDQTLTLESVSQEGGTTTNSILDGDTAHEHFSGETVRRSEGFGVEPPVTIEPGQNAYFEIPAKWLNGDTMDDTYLTYATSDGSRVYFRANVAFHWSWAVPYFLADHSSAGTSTDSLRLKIDKSTGKGTQTTFHLLEN